MSSELSVLVTTQYMSHESGTKYYQVFQVSPELSSKAAASITVMHWGPVAKCRSRRPVLGGQTQIKHGLLRSQAVWDKEKRGYRAHPEETITRKLSDSWWTETFGAALAHQLITSILPDGSGFAPTEVSSTAYLEKESAADAATDIRPEAWGSW